VFNVQSICTEAGKPFDPFNVNCVQRRCVRIKEVDLVALRIKVDGKWLVAINNYYVTIILMIYEDEEQWCRKENELIFDATVVCPAVETACANATIEIVDDVPPPCEL